MYYLFRGERRLDMKLKHPLDWYNENTPSEDEEYEKGCLSIFLIVAIISITLTDVILSYIL